MDDAVKRSPIKRKSAPKRTRKERGTARSSLDFTPDARAEIEYRSGGWCEAACTPNCQRRATHAHHILRRSQGGQGTEANGLHVCANCHLYIHEHPGQSYEQGWMKRSTT